MKHLLLILAFVIVGCSTTPHQKPIPTVPKQKQPSPPVPKALAKTRILAPPPPPRTNFWLTWDASLKRPVQLEWDRNPETNVQGYRVYTGRVSRTYEPPLDVSNAITTSFAVLPLGRTYFAVTAYNEELESEFSDEVFYDWNPILTPSIVDKAPINSVLGNAQIQSKVDLEGPWTEESLVSSNVWAFTNTGPMRMFRVRVLP